jgi:hypothetical protein
MDLHELHTRWAERETPDVEGIVFADGRLRQMTYWSSPSSPVWTPMLVATNWAPEGWLDLAVLVEEHRGDWIIQGGEASAHGSIGWVSGARAATPDRPDWVLTSWWSNPFAQLWIHPAWVEAATTNGYLWKIPLDGVGEVQIDSDG